MKLLTVAVLLVAAFARRSSGLRCLECSGVESEEECLAFGQIRECRFNERACEVELRRHEGWGGALKMYKHCKHTTACNDNHVQNPRAAWEPSQCNPDSFNSVCRCCCFTDECNVANEDCFNQPAPTCAIPQVALRFGSVSCTDGGNKGSMCTVTCGSNKQIVGFSTSFCRTDGYWSNPIARCADIQCPARKPLRYGWYICTNGELSGSRCHANCWPGYTLVGPRRMTCLNNGRWNVFREPRCESRQCPARGPVEGGAIACTDGNNLQSHCKIICAANMRAFGVMDNYCQDNGEWSHPLPRCELIQCPPRGRIKNGIADCTDGVEIGSNCDAFCETGYALNGVPNSVCLPTGAWSEPLPRCVRVNCPARGKVPLGEVSCSDSVNVGSICTVICRLGTALIGNDISECLSTGEWSIPLPACRRIECPDRGTVLGGSVSCTNRKYVGSICSAQCDIGTRIEGEAVSTCMSNGEWNYALPTCERITCPSLDFSLQPGSMSCSDDFNYRSTCRFTCERGYRRRGAPWISCKRNGRWTTRMPECRLIQCRPRGRIANGNVECTARSSIGSNCDVVCNEGFQVAGPAFSSCLPNGKWSRPLPVCEAISCPFRGTIVGGTVTCTFGNAYRSVCTASCGGRYQLVGTTVSQCMGNGQWDDPLPQCQLLPCQSQGDLEHGSITCTNEWNTQSVCTFRCEEEGYELYPSGRSRNVCGRNQRWNIPKPCCSRPCPPYAVMDIVIVLDSSSSIGTENWVFLTDFVRGIIRSFIIAPDAANFAIFRYNRAVDTNTQIFLNSYPGNVEALVDAFGRIPYDGSGTFTGNGLRHALEVSLSPANGNRPDVRDIVFVITDGKAADEVKIPADNLRAAGATVMVLGIEPPRGQLDVNELRDIAGGQEQNLVIASGGFAGLDTAFALRLSRTICGKPCE